MLHQRFRLLPTLLANLAVALFTLPVAVSAAPPFVETFHDEDSVTFAGPCPNGVILQATFTSDVRVTTFYDKEGNEARLHFAVNYVGVITNPDTGQSVEDNGHHTIIVDLVEGTETTVGLVFSASVPGVGVVFHDVGRGVFDFTSGELTFTGPHDVLNTEGDHAVRANFCKALT